MLERHTYAHTHTRTEGMTRRVLMVLAHKTACRSYFLEPISVRIGWQRLHFQTMFPVKNTHLRSEGIVFA